MRATTVHVTATPLVRPITTIGDTVPFVLWPPQVASAGNGQVSVAFVAPSSTGGSPITGYTATCGTQSVNGSMSPIVVTGLVNGVAVTCTVVARNAIGDSMPSATSNSVTPSMVVPAALLTVVSRKSHGTAGAYPMPVALGVPISGAITVEPRDSRGAHTLVFHFDNAITSIAGVSVTDAGLATVGTSYVTVAGSDVTVTLTDIPDNKRVTVTINAVNGGASASVALGFLVGDVNSSRAVNGADISRIKGQQGQSLNALNYLLDLNTSGTIDAADLAMAKARSGWVLP